MSPELIQALLVAVISSSLSSSGLWLYIQSRSGRKNANRTLLMNLAKGKIERVGMDYIDLGEISRDDLEELKRDLYDPYLELGGNGIAKRVMEEVLRLPLRQTPRYVRINRSEGSSRGGTNQTGTR